MTALPEGWTTEPFSEVATFSAGRTPARANATYWTGPGERYPWVAISDMTGYGTVAGTKETITERALDKVFRGNIVPAGTLLMSFKLTIGRVATLGIPACHNEAIISITPRSDIDQRYLGYYLSQFDYTVLQDRAIKGQTLNRDKISRIPVLLPPPTERTAISDVLDFVRRGIQIEERSEQLAAQIKRAAMHALFSAGLRGEPQTETEIGPIPSSWTLATLADAREWLQYGTSIRCSVEPAGYPVLRIPNIESGWVDPTDLKYCDMTEDDASKHLLEDGDLLFIRTNGVLQRLGSCAVYSGMPRRALFASYLIRARLKPAVEPRFVAYFYGSQQGTSLVAGRATPAADGKYNLNTGTIDSLPLPLPKTRDEQQEIVNVLEKIDHKIGLHRRKKAVLEDLFQVLLHKLMAGEIRVTDLDLSALASSQEAAA